MEANASPQGIERLLELLRDQSWEAVFMKEFAPTPGILTDEERKRFSCTSAH